MKVLFPPLLVAIICVFTSSKNLLQAQKNQYISETRRVDVCILIDGNYPVKDKVIKKTTDESFSQYLKNTGILFSIVETHEYFGHLDTLSSVQAMDMRAACQESVEIAIVFSSQVGPLKKLIVTMDNEKSDTSYVVTSAKSNMVLGYVILYRSQERFSLKDRGGNPAMVSGLNHELGHLFDVLHSEEPISFMFSNSDNSFGEWTEDVIDLIMQNMNKTWIFRELKSPND